MKPSPSGLTAAELQEQYDVEAAVPELPQIMADYQQRSETVRQMPNASIDLAYGEHRLQKLDIFAPRGATALPIQIYIHGGYWRGGSRLGRAFPAPVFNEAGAVWIPIDYRLLPEVSLDDIVTDVRDAVGWIYAHAGSFGGDRDRIHVSGSSAGGHLTAMLMLDGWHEAIGLPSDVVKSGCAISGLFELEPLRNTTENETLQLDDDLIHRNSPVRHPPDAGRPLIIAWGSKESGEFRRQSTDFAAALRKTGSPVRELELEGHDHFTATGELAKPESPLLRAILSQMGLERSG